MNFGNVIGSNIFNLLVVGVALIVATELILGTLTIARYIKEKQIKEINPKLKYEDIIRKAVVFTIDSQNEYITFNSVMDTFVELLKCYKSLQETGFDKPFRLCKNHFFYEEYSADENRSINFTVENAKVYKLNTTNQLAYANAISEAYSKDGLAQALSRGNEFCLIVKRGKYYIAEVYDGYVININGKNDATGLHVMY